MCVRYNPPQQMIFRSRLLVAAAALAFLLPLARAANWEQPVATLANQIAGLAGPGPVQLIVRNQSSLSADEVPQIQQLLIHDLRSHGITAGGANSPTQIRVTLSQNLRGGLWIAEVQEGTETRVTMLPVQLDITSATPGGPRLTLQRSVIITEPDAVLDAQIFSAGGVQRLIVLEPRQILVYTRSAASITPAGTAATGPSAWASKQTIPIPYQGAFPRDIRGRIVPAQDHLFDAYLPGLLCRGTNSGPAVAISCASSDDPWPITATQQAFYDAGRDYFMGVLVPGVAVQLAPFYEAASISRPTGLVTLLNNVDGSAVLVQSNSTEPVNGADNWGSDVTAIHSACGSGTQVVVSGSGDALAGDTLRAYEIPGREAIPVSPPLPVPGVITAIWPSNDGSSATVMVHLPGSAGPSQIDRYEVWSVAPSCN